MLRGCSHLQNSFQQIILLETTHQLKTWHAIPPGHLYKCPVHKQRLIKLLTLLGYKITMVLRMFVSKLASTPETERKNLTKEIHIRTCASVWPRHFLRALTITLVML